VSCAHLLELGDSRSSSSSREGRSVANERGELGPHGPAARAALVGPAARLGVDYEEKAARQVVSESASYPYFIQEYGLELWNHAEQSPIGLADLETVREIATDSVCSSVSAARIAPARAGLLPSRPALRLLA
jgi:hypothetical protein